MWYSTDVRAEQSPFSVLPGIWLAPFFQQKVYEWSDFSGFLCERLHFSDILVYAHFRSKIFRGCLSSWYYINWLWYLCNNQQKMGTKNQRAVYKEVNILDDQVYEWVRFFEGLVYEWGRFWNTGSHTRIKITPKLPRPRDYICMYVYMYGQCTLFRAVWENDINILVFTKTKKRDLLSQIYTS